MCMRKQMKINECSEEGPENRYAKYIDHGLHLGFYGTMPLQKSHVNRQVTTLRQTEEISVSTLHLQSHLLEFPRQINIKNTKLYTYISKYTY